MYTILNQGHRHFSIETVPHPLEGSHGYLFDFLGFTEDLRGQTHGTGFPQCVFDHWQLMPGDPREAGNKAHAIVTDVRNRKGLNPVIPALDNYLDKL